MEKSDKKFKITNDELEDLGNRWEQACSHLMNIVEEATEALGNLEMIQEEYKCLYVQLKKIIDLDITQNIFEVMEHLEDIEAPYLTKTYGEQNLVSKDDIQVDPIPESVHPTGIDVARAEEIWGYYAKERS